MSDFCMQCSIENFGEDSQDFKGIAFGEESATVLCEGCGITSIDSDGKCLSKVCDKKHNSPKGNKYIAMLETSTQISEDSWRVNTVSLSLEPSTTISDVIEWANTFDKFANVRVVKLDEIKNKG